MSKMHRALLMVSYFDLYEYIPTALLKFLDTILLNSKRCIWVKAAMETTYIVLSKMKHQQIPITVVEYFSLGF